MAEAGKAARDPENGNGSGTRRETGAGPLKPGLLYPRGVRGLLFCLLLVMLVPSLLVEAALNYVGFQERRAQEFQANLEVARWVAATFHLFVRDILHQELALGQAATSPLPLPPEEVSRHLAGIAREYPAVRHFSWIDPRGRVAAAGAPGPAGMEVGATPYFQAIAAGEESVVSDLFLDPLTGEPGFVIARGIRDDRGLLGAVGAMVDPSRLGEVLLVERAERGAVALIDGRGRGVYRYPPIEMTWDQRDWLSGQPIIARALVGEEAAGTITAVEGTEQMAAFMPIPPLGWVASAGRSTSEAMGPAVQEVVWELGLVGLAALSAFGVALILGRRLTVPMRRLQELALAAGRGDLGARADPAGPVELVALAETFNRMAGEIRWREEQREEYLWAVSHDLRSPLAVIQGHAQLLQRRAGESPPDSPLRLSTNAIFTATHRMNSMIQDLVDTARLESGQLRLNLFPIALNGFLLDLRQRLQGLPDAERLRIEAPEELPPVMADPDRLERILMNLLTNALSYSAPRSEVLLSAARHGDELVVSVSDRGRGIPPAELPRLFQRYYRARPPSERRDGLGLGLYITRGLVEVHGGRIWVESEVGVGSTFRFSLPVAGPSPES